MESGGVIYLVLTQPIYNLVVWLYDTIALQDFGIAIILVTILIKVILMPLTARSVTSQKALQDLQPKMEEIKRQYKDDRERQAKEMMALYKQEKVNPMSSCFPILIQLPILLGLYNALRRAIEPNAFDMLYTFVPAPEVFHTLFLGLVDLAHVSIPLAILAGAVQYVQTKMLQTQRPPKTVRDKDGAMDEDMAAAMTRSMTYTMPIMTIVFGATLPGGVTLYWLFSNIVSVLQQWFLFRKKPPLPTT